MIQNNYQNISFGNFNSWQIDICKAHENHGYERMWHCHKAVFHQALYVMAEAIVKAAV